MLLLQCRGGRVDDLNPRYPTGLGLRGRNPVDFLRELVEGRRGFSNATPKQAPPLRNIGPELMLVAGKLASKIGELIENQGA